MKMMMEMTTTMLQLQKRNAKANEFRPGVANRKRNLMTKVALLAAVLVDF